jgi:hypothetical protein
MSVRMRWRAASAFITAVAAGAAVLALAVPAGASTGTTEISPEQAGYTATGAQFRTVAVSVYLRNPGQYASEVGGYGLSVQLWSSDLVLVLGVSSSTSSTAGFVPAAIIYNRSTHAVITQTRGTVSFPAGDTVRERLDYNRGGFEYFHITDSAGRSFTPVDSVATSGSFTQARVGTEFGTDPWTAPSSYTPPAQYTKIAVYSKASLITYNNDHSSLWSWWVHHKLLANTEQQSSSDWVAIPGDLTNGGANFQTRFVPQSGQSPSQPVLH